MLVDKRFQREALRAAKTAAGVGMSDFRVSDHAMLRYLERVLGMGQEIADVREFIERRCKGAALADAMAVKVDAVQFVIENHAVVRCLTEDVVQARKREYYRPRADMHRDRRPAQRLRAEIEEAPDD